MQQQASDFGVRWGGVFGSWVLRFCVLSPSFGVGWAISANGGGCRCGRARTRKTNRSSSAPTHLARPFIGVGASWGGARQPGVRGPQVEGTAGVEGPSLPPPTCLWKHRPTTCQCSCPGLMKTRQPRPLPLLATNPSDQAGAIQRLDAPPASIRATPTIASGGKGRAGTCAWLPGRGGGWVAWLDTGLECQTLTPTPSFVIAPPPSLSCRAMASNLRHFRPERRECRVIP